MARIARNQAYQNRKPITQKTIRRNPHGLKKVYDPARFPTAANVLCREHGFTKVQLAEVFGVTNSVICTWMSNHEEFRKAVQDGLDHFESYKVERTLFSAALGYEYEEQTISITHDKFGKPHENVTIAKKKMQPNIKAITFWLTNRQKERWKQESTINANVNGSVTHTDKSVKITADLSKMDVNQLKTLREMIMVQKENDTVEIDTNIQPLLEYGRDIMDAEYKNV